LVVDDKSTDKTVDVLLQLIREDERISYKTNNDYPRGPAGARNSGIDECFKNYEYIAFLDSYDEWTPNYLQNALQQFEVSPHAKVVVSDLRRLTEDGKVLISSKFKNENGLPAHHSFTNNQDFFEFQFGPNSLSEAIERRLTIGLHSAVFKRNIFDQKRLVSARVAEDHLLTLELIQDKTPIIYVNKLGLNYYVHDSNISSANPQTDTTKQYKNSILEIRLLKQFANQNNLKKNELEKLHQRLGALYFWYIGYSHFNQIKKYKTAYKAYAVGIKYVTSVKEKFKMRFTMVKCQLKVIIQFFK
jgi:glycosyltransferase involved in cell wall biosynthesis